MSEEFFCDRHGPYAASYGSCPFCAQEQDGRPVAPPPLDSDETLGNFSPGFGTIRVGDDDATVLPGQMGREQSWVGGGSDETELPGRVVRGGQDLDSTQLPERKRRRILDGDEDDIDQTVLEREDTSVMGWLIVKRSPVMRRGHILKIRPGIILGRSPRKADLMIDDEKISGLHARIQFKDGNFIVMDLGSANGTWVNDAPVDAPQVLRQDDEIRLGDTVVVLKTL